MKTTAAKSTKSDTGTKENQKSAFFGSSPEKPKPFFGRGTIQPKLKIGSPNDKYEKEADRVADQVMRMPDNSFNNSIFVKPTQPVIQRQVPSPDAEPQPRKGSAGDVVEAVVSMPQISLFLNDLGNDFLRDLGTSWDESLLNKFGLIGGGLGIAGGLGLTIYAARNDPEALDFMVSPLSGTVIPAFDFEFFPYALRSFALEVNFDRYDENGSVRNIMGGLHFDVGRLLPPILGFGPVEEWAPIGAPPIRRKCKECEEEDKLQKKTETTIPSDSNNYVNSDISSRIKSIAGRGSSLPANVQSEMENKIGADFSGVNIHTGPEANKLNHQLNARAFTHGSGIYFNEGEYNPNSRNGKKLLVHELAHVAQQNKDSQQINKSVDPRFILVKTPSAQIARKNGNSESEGQPFVFPGITRMMTPFESQLHIAGLVTQPPLYATLQALLLMSTSMDVTIGLGVQAEGAAVAGAVGSVGYVINDGRLGFYGSYGGDIGAVIGLSAEVVVTVIDGGLDMFSGVAFAAVFGGGEVAVGHISILMSDSAGGFLGIAVSGGVGIGLTPVEAYLTISNTHAPSN